MYVPGNETAFCLKKVNFGRGTFLGSDETAATN